MITLKKVFCALASCCTFANASTDIMITAALNDSSSTELEDAFGNIVSFYNPCFHQEAIIEKTVNIITIERISISNGSMLNFSSKGMIGDLINCATKLNDIPNPLKITHSGIVIIRDVVDMYNHVLNLMEQKSKLSEREGKPILNELLESYELDIKATYRSEKKKEPFVMEADGSVSEVLSLTLPHVHIHTLSNRLKEYDGNIFIRTLYNPIAEQYSNSFIDKYLGTSYEMPHTISDLLLSPLAKNKTENTENLFCSELAALFYKGYQDYQGEHGIKGIKIIDNDILVNNVTPELLSSGAGKKYDILYNYATADIPLKISYNFLPKQKKFCSLL